MSEIIDEVRWAADASNDIADSLRRIADAADHLRQSGLTERGLVALIKANTGGMAQDDIRAVLRGLSGLRHFIQESKTDDQQA